MLVVLVVVFGVFHRLASVLFSFPITLVGLTGMELGWHLSGQLGGVTA
ncbi:hypothetical protein SynBIOSU31_02074 [Synechococcus sp. BIOS-U3-1]|nr:hypothetical protein SynBIOSU31_02074 [Synechococcus sp. BIOS-U3-1]